MRYAILTSKQYTLMFTAEPGMSDSKFLHNILCELDPTGPYTVSFTDAKPRMTNNRKWYYGEGLSSGPNFVNDTKHWRI